MERFGVNVLAAAAPVVGLMGLLGPLSLLIGYLMPGGINDGSFRLVAFIVFVALATFAAEVAFARGAVMPRPWVWAVGVIAQVLLLLNVLLWTIRIDPFSIGFNYQSIICFIAGAMLVYLVTPGVQRAFGRA